jgi:uncharacterized membrane protein
LSARAARIALTGLSLAGVGVTLYLLYARATHTQLACTTGGCETVQESRYAELAGIPVAGLGLAGYLAILATTFVRAEAGRAAAVALALSALVFSGYLLAVQLFVLHAICLWCVVSDAIVLLITIVAVADATSEPAHAAGDALRS